MTHDAGISCCADYGVMQNEIKSLKAFLEQARSDLEEAKAEIDAIMDGTAHAADLREMEFLRGELHNALADAGRLKLEIERWRDIANAHARQLSGYAVDARAKITTLEVQIKEYRKMLRLDG